MELGIGRNVISWPPCGGCRRARGGLSGHRRLWLCAARSRRSEGEHFPQMLVGNEGHLWQTRVCVSILLSLACASQTVEERKTPRKGMLVWSFLASRANRVVIPQCRIFVAPAAALSHCEPGHPRGRLVFKQVGSVSFRAAC